MTRSLLLLPVLALGFVLGGAVPLQAQAGEAQLRESLKSTTLQLRSAQNDLAAAQAAQAALAEEKKGLLAQVELLKKHAVEDGATARQKLDALATTVAVQKADLERFREALDKWKAAREQAVEAAQTLEAARARLALENGDLHNRLTDAEARNRSLFKLGNEILTRYEKFSLGEALAAREPFVGTTRARLENLVQDYQDKLRDQRLKQ